MDREEIIELTEEYILNNIDEDSIDYDVDIFEESLVSSLFTIELMTFIEKEFEVKVLMDELNLENFNTINHIADFVCGKLK